MGLGDLATALQNIAAQLGRLISQTSLQIVVPILQGGTGATSAAGALTSLGVGTAGTKAASNNADSTVASVTGAVTVGHLAIFADSGGSVEDGGAIPVIPGITTVFTTGAWAPVLAFGGASVGISGTFLGSYAKITNGIRSEITCRYLITLTSKGSSTGAATISGLPFPPSSDPTNAGSGGIVAAYSNMASLSGFFGSVGASSSMLTLFINGAAAATAATNSDFTNTSTFAGQFSYIA